MGKISNPVAEFYLLEGFWIGFRSILYCKWVKSLLPPPFKYMQISPGFLYNFFSKIYLDSIPLLWVLESSSILIVFFLQLLDFFKLSGEDCINVLIIAFWVWKSVLTWAFLLKMEGFTFTFSLNWNASATGFSRCIWQKGPLVVKLLQPFTSQGLETFIFYLKLQCGCVH